MVATHIVLALQTIASRNADPLQSVVVSVTSFRTGPEAFNVIPETAEERLHAICTGIAATFGANVTIDRHRGNPAMVNAATASDYAAEVAARVSGHVDTHAPAIRGGEDFACMLEACPGADIQIGYGDSADVHHPEYDFNDSIIPTGVGDWVRLAQAATV